MKQVKQKRLEEKNKTQYFFCLFVLAPPSVVFDCVCSLAAVLERSQVLFTLSGRDGRRRRRTFRPGRWLVNVDAGTGQRQGQLLGALGAGAGPVEDLVHRAGHASHVFTGDDGVGGAKVCAAHSVVVVVVLVWIFFFRFFN